MSALDPTAQREVVAEACRAPSVHNVQPTRWRFSRDGRVHFLRALERSLPAADPHGHDVRASVGAAFEGTALALSRRGLGLTAPVLKDEPAGPGLAMVAEAQLQPGANLDPLAEWTSRRRAFRGVFPRARPETVAALRRLESDDARVVSDPAEIAWIGGAYDAANLGLVGRADYEAELYRWLRLLPSHPGWDRDGLTAPCLVLSDLEARAANVLLRPAAFAWVKRLRLAGVLLSEARAIRSAAAVILFCPERSMEPFHVGRRFHRLWLEVTRAGCVLCPLSALADDQTRADMAAVRYGIPAARRVANAFRVGVAPAEPARSPRLPVDELIV